MGLDGMSLATTVVIGTVAGFLASLIVGGGGLLRYLVTGVLGAFVGSFLLQALGISFGLGYPLLDTILTATLGAVVVVLVARLIA